MDHDGPNPLFDLRGRVALVTGSTGGLGYEIAMGLGRAGAHVYIHGRNPDKAQAASAELAAAGIAASWVAFDMNDRAAAAQGFEHIGRERQRLDILVNNASIRMRKSLQDLDAIDIESIIRTNILSSIEVSRAAISLMRLNGYGRIVTISSIAGKLIRLGDFIYPVTKQALNTMVKSLAIEYGRENILSNAIAPGTFATEFNATLVKDAGNIAKMEQRNPLKRWGEPAEIVGPAVFLASPAASYVNGQVLTVDGGFSIAF